MDVPKDNTGLQALLSALGVATSLIYLPSSPVLSGVEGFSNFLSGMLNSEAVSSAKQSKQFLKDLASESVLQAKDAERFVRNYNKGKKVKVFDPNETTKLQQQIDENLKNMGNIDISLPGMGEVIASIQNENRKLANKIQELKKNGHEHSLTNLDAFKKQLLDLDKKLQDSSSKMPGWAQGLLNTITLGGYGAVKDLQAKKDELNNLKVNNEAIEAVNVVNKAFVDNANKANHIQASQQGMLKL